MKIVTAPLLLLLLSCSGGVVEQEPLPPNSAPLPSISAVAILPGDVGAVCHQDSECTGGLVCEPPSGTGRCSSTSDGSLYQMRRAEALNAEGKVGYPCQADSECKGGLLCLRPANTVSAAGGICSMVCSSSELERSCGVDHGGICAAVGESKFCLAACGTGTFSCATASCAQVGAAQVCIPGCLADSQCATACDLQTRLCTTTAQRGVAAVGAKCASPADCKTGVCENSRCTARCNVGAIAGCGEERIYYAGVGGPMCFPLDPQNYFVGNAGECVQSCNCDKDCANPDAVCELMGNDLYSVLGILYRARGHCVAQSSAPTKGTPQCSM